MRVADIYIENFRGIRQGSVRFGTHTVLIGDNNSGKTTVIEALTLVLGRDRLIRDLSEHDFYGSDPRPADRIKLIATITDFPGDDPNLHVDWFRDGRGVPKWLDLPTGEIHPIRVAPELRLCCQIGVQAYFDRQSLTVEVLRYFHDHDEPMDPFDEDAPVTVPPRLIQHFGFFLVRASRTWDRILSWGSELFRRTLQAAAAQPSEAILTQRDHLRAPHQAIDEDPQIAPLIADVNAEVARCIPSAPTLRLRVTNTDSRSVLDAIAPHYRLGQGPDIPAARQGHGLISLQGLFLLLELGKARHQAGDGFTMAFEEPELHLPPATQQQLVLRTQALTAQTFLTTHSPTIAAMADPTSVILLRNRSGILTSEPFLKTNLPANAPNWQRKFFQHSRTAVIDALMHPVVLVPEGRSEHLLLQTILRPLMLRQDWAGTHGQGFGLQVGVVPTEDAKVIETARLLSRVHASICCLVDGDAEGLRYANELLAADFPVRTVLRWPDGLMLEDMIGWVIEADPASIAALPNDFAALADNQCETLVAHMKEKKCDLVLYESVAEAIAASPACRNRAAELFESIEAVCSERANPHFVRVGGAWVFAP